MSTPAGWYPNGEEWETYWDGTAWTDQHRPKAPAPAPAPAAAATEPGVLWSAVGKPLTGIGGGRYKLTAEYLVFEKGTLSTKSQQIRTAEIFDVDASQSMAQKARGIGTIKLHARRPSGDETVLLEDVPGFREGVAIINDTADASRRGIQQRQNTQHVSYAGAAPVGAAAPAPAAAAAPGGVDLNAELAKLASFHASGILSDEEFAAGKRKLLGL